MSRSITRILATSAAAASLALFVTACNKADSAGGAAPESAAATGSASATAPTAAIGTPISLADLPPTAKTVTLGVTGMTCDACVGHITETLAAMDGVLQETVSLEQKSAMIAYDPAKVKVEDLAAAITKLKYTVALPEMDAAKAAAGAAADTATNTISGFPEAPADVPAAPGLPDVDTLKAKAVETLEAAKATAMEKGTTALDGAKTTAAEKATTALEGVPTMPEAPATAAKPAVPALPAMPKLPGK